MGRRYYCDFCDKRFIDDLEGRKKHLASAHHIKMKKLHYDMFVGESVFFFFFVNFNVKMSFKDAKTIFEQETQKFPCKRFLQNGDCQFKGNCKYSHYSNGQLMELKEQSKYLPVMFGNTKFRSVNITLTSQFRAFSS